MNAYGFQSIDDFHRVVGAALKNEIKDYSMGPMWLPPAVREVSVIVQITGSMVANDRRSLYPAAVYLRNTLNPPTSPETNDWYGVGSGLFIPQLGNMVYAAGLNREPLVLNRKYEGRAAGILYVQDPAYPGDATKTYQVSLVLVDAQRTTEIVRVISSVTNAYGEKAGYVQNFNTTTNLWQDGESVWVRDANA